MSSSTSAQKESDRVEQFKRNVRALNAQFVEWCCQQVDSKPDRLLVAGVADYLRHAAKLRLEYSEVINETGEFVGIMQYCV